MWVGGGCFLVFFCLGAILCLLCHCATCRAHMHKGRTQRRTVVKRAGQQKQACVEQVDKSRKGPKCDLQQHLQQLFHHHCQEEKEGDDEMKE